MSNPTQNTSGNLCQQCKRQQASSSSVLCSGCILRSANAIYNLGDPDLGATINAELNAHQPPGTSGAGSGDPFQNGGLFNLYSNIETFSEHELNQALYTEGGNLNFLNQPFPAGLPPRMAQQAGQRNTPNSSSPHQPSQDQNTSQQQSEANRFSSPPYEEEDELNGIWVGDKNSADNVFYYGVFPGSLLGNSKKETQEVCEKMATLFEETAIEDNLPMSIKEEPISTAAKRHLLDLYFKYHYPFFPILDKTAIMDQFDKGKIPSLLLNAIFAVAYFYTDEKSMGFFAQFKDRSKEEVAEQFESLAKQCLDECFSEAELPTIQALLLMTLYHHRASISNNVWLYSGMATRMAMELGLHKDCESLFSTTNDNQDQELNKKIWWGCFILDTLYSTMLGRPLSIQQELSDVKLPVIADDEDNQQVIIVENTFIAFAKLAKILGKLNRLLTSVKLKSNLRERANRSLECMTSLKNWFKGLPATLKQLNLDQPINLAEMKNCSSQNILAPYLHLMYHVSCIVGQTLCHTDSLFRIVTPNMMKDAITSANEITRIMTAMENVFAKHGPAFIHYPSYVSSFLFMHKIKLSPPTPNLTHDPNYSLLISCLQSLHKLSERLENGRFSTNVITGLCEHLRIPLPEVYANLRQKSLVSQGVNTPGSGHPGFFAGQFPPQFLQSLQTSAAAFQADGSFDPNHLQNIAAQFNQGGQPQASFIISAPAGSSMMEGGQRFANYPQGDIPMSFIRPEDIIAMGGNMNDPMLGMNSNIHQSQQATITPLPDDATTYVSQQSYAAPVSQHPPHQPHTVPSQHQAPAQSQHQVPSQSHHAQPQQFQQYTHPQQAYTMPPQQAYTAAHMHQQQPGYQTSQPMYPTQPGYAPNYQHGQQPQHPPTSQQQQPQTGANQHMYSYQGQVPSQAPPHGYPNQGYGHQQGGH
jgi:hypothetical protein